MPEEIVHGSTILRQTTKAMMIGGNRSGSQKDSSGVVAQRFGIRQLE